MYKSRSSLFVNTQNITPPNTNAKSRSFFTHLDIMKESYWTHFKAAMRFSRRSFQASLYFFCHAIWPDLFQHSGSDIILALQQEIVDKYNASTQHLQVPNNVA